MERFTIRRTDIGLGYTLVENLDYKGSKIIERNNGPSLEFFLYDEQNDMWRMFHKFPEADEDAAVDCSVDFSYEVDAYLKGVLKAYNDKNKQTKPKKHNRCCS